MPNLSAMNSTEQKLRAIQDYLYILLEQLRYTLENLGAENFNPTALAEITGPIYRTIEDGEKGLRTELRVTAEGISTRVESAEGDISQLQQTAAGLRTDVTSAQGDISSLQQTATGLTSRVESAEGDISTLQQTATGLTSRVSGAEGNISALQQTASGLTSRVSSTEGNVSALQQTASGISASVSSLSTGLAHALIFDSGGLKLYDQSNNAVKLSHGNLNLTGSISFSDLDSGTQSTINSKISVESESIARSIAAGTYANGSFIKKKEIYGPTIYTNELNIFPEKDNQGNYQAAASQPGGLRLYEWYNEVLYEFLRIYPWNQTVPPITHLGSPAEGEIYMDSVTRFTDKVYFEHSVDFSHATVTGLPTVQYLSFS